jgi:hypothetical protein
METTRLVQSTNRNFNILRSAWTSIFCEINKYALAREAKWHSILSMIGSHVPTIAQQNGTLYSEAVTHVYRDSLTQLLLQLPHSRCPKCEARRPSIAVTFA